MKDTRLAQTIRLVRETTTWTRLNRVRQTIGHRIPTVFINYFDNCERASPLNLAMMRTVLSSYVILRLIALDVAAVVGWPVQINTATALLYPPESFMWVVLIEEWLVILGACCLFIGLWTRVAALVTGIGFAHIAGMTMVINNSGETEQMVLGAALILLVGLYTRQDYLSADTYFQISSWSRATLANELNPETDSTQCDNGAEYKLHDRYRLTPLAAGIVIMGITYAGSVYARVVSGSLVEWVSPANMRRFLLYHVELTGHETLVTELILRSDILLLVAGVGTNLLEAGLLVIVLAGGGVTIPIAGLISMHVGIAVSMGIVFTDMVIFLLLFLAYDSLVISVPPDELVTVTHGGTQSRSTRLVYFLRVLDHNNRIVWCNGTEFAVTIGSTSRNGWGAIGLSCRFFRVTIPLYYLERGISKLN